MGSSYKDGKKNVGFHNMRRIWLAEEQLAKLIARNPVVFI